MPRKYESLEHRLLANSVAEWNPDLQSYCWIWVAGKVVARSQDYGRLNVHHNGKHTTFLAHRLAYEAFTGKTIPTGYEIDHACSNGLCISPDHLSAVPHSENMFLHYRRKG